MARLICQRVDLDSTGRTSQGSSYKVWLWSDQCPRFHSEPFPILHPAESCIRRYCDQGWWCPDGSSCYLNDATSAFQDDQMPRCHTCQPAVSPMDAEPCWPAGWREQCRNLLPSWACALHHSSSANRVEMCCMYSSWSGLQKSENVGRRSSLKFLNHDVNNGWFSGSKTPSNNLGVSKPSIGTAPSRMSASFLAPSRNRPSVDLWVTQHMSKLLLVAFWLLHQFHLPTNLPGRSEWEVTRNRLRSWGEVGMQRAKPGAIDSQNGGHAGVYNSWYMSFQNDRSVITKLIVSHQDVRLGNNMGIYGNTILICRYRNDIDVLGAFAPVRLQYSGISKSISRKVPPNPVRKLQALLPNPVPIHHTKQLPEVITWYRAVLHPCKWKFAGDATHIWQWLWWTPNQLYPKTLESLRIKLQVLWVRMGPLVPYPCCTSQSLKNNRTIPQSSQPPWSAAECSAGTRACTCSHVGPMKRSIKNDIADTKKWRENMVVGQAVLESNEATTVVI